MTVTPLPPPALPDDGDTVLVAPLPHPAADSSAIPNTASPISGRRFAGVNRPSFRAVRPKTKMPMDRGRTIKGVTPA